MMENNVSFVYLEDSPVRLDVALTKKIEGLSRSQIANLTKNVLVNGTKQKLSYKLKTGDFVLCEYLKPLCPTYEMENIPLKIIYEDEDIIAVYKKCGMVVHPSPTVSSSTLLNALNYYRLNTSKIKDEFVDVYKKNCSKTSRFACDLPSSDNDLWRLGIVHRLDKDTSGLIITARNIRAQQFLKKEFRERRVKKYYVALLNGVPKKKKEVIKTSIFRRKRDGRFVASNNLNANRLSISSYKVIKTFGNFSLVKFRIYTGRTHQIRCHAKYMSCPVLGDKIYGNSHTNLPLFLHAYKITIKTPSNFFLTLKLNLPKRFKKAIRNIKKKVKNGK